MPTRARASAMRHVVNVMRPVPHEGQKGDGTGKPEEIYHEWPCSIVTLSGRELERAQQMNAVAELEVKGYGDPRKPIKEKDHLTFGSRQLNVVAVIDKNQNGIDLKLLCGEERNG